jgi:hypothetical protein
MLLTDAKTYIARVIGGQGDSNVLALAADAILATASKWNLAHNWEYLRKDNSTTRSMTITVSGGVTCTVTSTAGLNVGQSFVDSGSTTATISSITSTTVFVASTTVVTGTATFAAYVPVISGTSNYFFPADFSDLYGARLLTTKRVLDVVRLREVNREVTDQAANGASEAILFSPGGTGSGWTAADQRARFRIVGIPGTTEFLHLDYYRKIDGSASTLDFPDEFVYPFLDDCKAWLLRQKNSNDPRADILAGLAAQGLKDAIDFDSGIDDEDVRIKSQFETFKPFTYTPGFMPNDF